jgi:hypothetical protein
MTEVVREVNRRASAACPEDLFGYRFGIRVPDAGAEPRAQAAEQFIQVWSGEMPEPHYGLR